MADTDKQKMLAMKRNEEVTKCTEKILKITKENKVNLYTLKVKIPSPPVTWLNTRNFPVVT